MTDTTTATAAEDQAEDLLSAAERAQREAGAKTLATIEPEQVRFNEDQLAILRALGVEDASDGDLNLFFHYCRTTGLDPFRKQIYMIGRNTKITRWVDNASGEGRRKVEEWVTKYTIQTGIDGYRRNGREAAKALGDSLRFEGPYFTGADDFHVTDDGQVIQHWRTVWPAGSVPHAARYVIYRNDEPFEGIAHFDEFVQTNAIWEGEGRSRKIVGEEPNSMWRKMPRNQIAKCAEALAWRRAYPDDFSGLILEDAAQPTVIDPDGNVEQEGAPEPRRRPGSGAAAARAARERRTQQRGQVVDGEVIPPSGPGQGGGNEQDHGAEPSSGATSASDPADRPAKTAMRKALEKRLFALIGEIDSPEPINRDDRIAIYRHVIGRSDIASTDSLDNVEVGKVCDQLYTWKQEGVLDAKVIDIIIAADSAAAEDASKDEK